MKINPKIVDGEPVCNSVCGEYFSMMGEPDFCFKTKEVVSCGSSPCVPGLKQQRDESKAKSCDVEGCIRRPYKAVPGKPTPLKRSCLPPKEPPTRTTDGRVVCQCGADFSKFGSMCKCPR